MAPVMAIDTNVSAPEDGAPQQQTPRPRTMTSVDEIHSTISRPGSVKINVTGAFIVDPDASTPAVGAGTGSSLNGASEGSGSPTHHETSDIRLPNHTAVVSHIAIDVSACTHSDRFFL